MKKRYISIFSLTTALNIFIVMHMETSGNLRDGIAQNYLRGFQWWDIFLFAMLCLAIYGVTFWFSEKGKPYLQYRFANRCMEENRWTERKLFVCIFVFLFAIWFFFFLVMYPGTAMNDTIYILNHPRELCYQHPVLYIGYTYFFYKVGLMFDNPNLGIALLSLVQIFAMDYVVTYAIMLLYRKKAAVWLCMLLACYFAFAPLFSTYAVSAIKDTPFSIALFFFVILLWELADSKGGIAKESFFLLEMYDFSISYFRL